MEDIFKNLQTNIQEASRNSPSYLKRLNNINWIQNLDRTDLSFRNKEKQILILTPEANTEILIQYPGKESVSNIREPEKTRPWDFRPKILYKDKSDYQPDLDFDTLWKDFEQQFFPLKEKDALRVLSIVLYRMAFMLDHSVMNQNEFIVKYIEHGKIIKEGREKLSPFLIYSPPEEAVEFISQHIKNICGMTCKDFLYYIELLTWNEDCKYYYRQVLARDAMAPRRDGRERAIRWINETGRINTLLTVINFLGVVLGEVKFSDIFSKFARYGVAGATEESLNRICKDFIV